MNGESLKVEGTKDAELAQGIWSTYKANGQVLQTGQMKDGFIVGKWQYNLLQGAQELLWENFEKNGLKFSIPNSFKFTEEKDSSLYFKINEDEQKFFAFTQLAKDPKFDLVNFLLSKCKTLVYLGCRDVFFLEYRVFESDKFGYLGHYTTNADQRALFAVFEKDNFYYHCYLQCSKDELELYRIVLHDFIYSVSYKQEFLLKDSFLPTERVDCNIGM
jgi:hypothetical protein